MQDRNKFFEMDFKNSKGFTLIELLVAISIISLLSSIVFSALGNARNKAKDAAIKIEVDEFVKLMQLEYDENGNYCNLQEVSMIGPWTNGFLISTSHSCNSLTTGTNPVLKGNYANQAVSVCNSIYNNARSIWAPVADGDSRIYWGVDFPVSCKDSYSIGVGLNNGKIYCAGSSGSKGERNDIDTEAGCHNNP